MTINQREYLAAGSRLRLYRKNANEPAEWVILDNKIVGEGASSVCYTAATSGKRGRLKEFYPLIVNDNTNIRSYCQVRDDDNQLIPGKNENLLIYRQKKEFLRAYETLEEVKNKNCTDSILNNFIPPFEILYGSLGNKGEQSVYIWTLDDKAGITFEQYLGRVHAECQGSSDDRLYNILVTILTLTDAVTALHFANLLHLDIKPSNFMIPYTGGHELNPGSISLFDINSLYRLGGSKPKSYGTKGYSAPELAKGKCENRSDIYSIGAMLYHALMGTDILYSDKEFGSLAEKINSSALIKASDPVMQPELKEKLTDILRNCLNTNPDKRYDCCEDLVAELKKAIVLLEPAIKRKYLGPYRRFEIVNIELKDQKNPNAIIYNLLYKNPIYKYVPDQEKNIRIMVFGSGEFVQSFIGISLQSCQMADRNIIITVVADNAEQAKKEYLKMRPAVAGFVNINGSLKKGEEAYGTVNFVQGSFKSGEREANLKTIKTLIEMHGSPQYVFIALDSVDSGADSLNIEVAQALGEWAGAGLAAQTDVRTETLKKRDSGFINYVISDKEKFRTELDGNPVFVNENITAESIDPGLDRMAFNVHMLWSDSTNLDYRELYRQMRTENNGYNYISSIAFVLSIPYKLWSIGVKFENADVAAKAFQQVVDAYEQKHSKAYSKLVQLEHRRWVLEKICNKPGWRPPAKRNGENNYESCLLRGSVKDNRNRVHPCIVRSTAEMPLKGRFYSENGHEKWNIPNKKDLELDELDRMSVEIHRTFYRKAQEVIESLPLQTGDILFIENLVSHENEEVVRAFNRYRYCIRNILNGNKVYSGQFEQTEKEFKKVLEEKASPETKIEILGNEITGGRLEKIRYRLFPVIESNMYRDYKALDEVLVQNIPFILTYKPGADLVLAFEDGHVYDGNTTILKNVASATVLNPKSVTFLYYYKQNVDRNLFLRKLISVTNYYSRRIPRCKINLRMALAPLPVQQKDAEDIDTLISEIRKDTVVDNITVSTCNTEQEVRDFLFTGFSESDGMLFDGTTRLFPSKAQNTIFMQKIKEQVPYFEFDFHNKHFSNLNRCENLRFLENSNILKKAYLRIEDIILLLNIDYIKQDILDISDDFEILWKIYTGEILQIPGKDTWRYAIKNWNAFCNRLGKYAQRHDEVCRIEVNRQKKDFQKYTYVFPSRYIADARRFYSNLCQLNIISGESRLFADKADRCVMEVFTKYELSPLLDKVFLEPWLYLAGQDLNVKRESINGKDCFVVRHDNLLVHKWRLDNTDSFSLELLNRLSEFHFINGLQITGRPQAGISRGKPADGLKATFSYASPDSKKLLCNPEKILELYVYYEIIKTGCFDDVLFGKEFQKKDGSIVNELNGILAKGFKTIVVGFKKQFKQKRNNNKPCSASGLSDIAAIKVVIDSDLEAEGLLDGTGQVVQKSGLEYAIGDKDQLIHIGETLRKIMEIK